MKIPSVRRAEDENSLKYSDKVSLEPKIEDHGN